MLLILRYGYAPYGLFKKLGIRGPKPMPFIGTFLGYTKVRRIQMCDLSLHSSYNGFDFVTPLFLRAFTISTQNAIRNMERCGGKLYDGRQPIIATMDTAMIKAVLVKECYSVFTNRRMYPIMLQHSVWMLWTSTAFSVDIDSINNPSDPFVSNIKRMVKFNFLNPLLVLIVLFPFLGGIFEKMDVSFFPAEVTGFFYNFLASIKSDRNNKEHKNRVDFMQLMVDSQSSKNKDDASSNKGLTDHEILSQAMIFIIAGYETSSSTLGFVAYTLATHPEIQKILQEEIDETLPEKDRPTYEAAMQMEYLEMVINETMRLYPIANRLERMSKSSVEINGVTIPKGTVITVPIYTLHRDPDLWSEPEAFKPERFSKENKANIDPYAFLPFGAGPKNCIGMQFALLMMKLALVEILQNFSFVTCKETDIPMELGVDELTTPRIPSN
ncbi:hypothetical protein F7725_000782 [Dissostichus mawsoni]|uniref:unspecific monooxygenase n=1 Tax=Dissostichus mawsoni TaxID=36200 RepID=A0A7J5ZIM7_DISMA|nr:hypothetical protein F7725_000782 [Dissostichus mawsoni]